MRHYILLGFAVLACLTIRIALPWGSIFHSGHVNFCGPDSYYHMTIMKGMLPTFAHAFWQHPYDALIVGFVWLLSAGKPTVSLLEHFAVFVPPVLAVLTLLMVYLIARSLFSARVGLIASFALALLPGEFLGRTWLGAVDHHAFEVLLNTGIIMCLVLATRVKSIINTVFLLEIAAVIFVIYKQTWIGYPLMLLPFALFAAVCIRDKLYVTLPAFILGVYIVAALTQNGPSFQSPLTLVTTAEAQHGWSAYLVMTHVLLSAVFVPPAVRYGKEYKFALAGWVAYLIGLTLWQERFDYYLAVPLAILLALCIEKAYSSLRESPGFMAALSLVTLTVIVIMMVALPFLSKQEYHTPSDGWYRALIWVKQNTAEDAEVIAWWDYGYWFDYIAERRAYCTPSQEPERVTAVARFFASGSDSPALPPPDGGQCYVVVDRVTAHDFLPAIKLWAGTDDNVDPVALKLYEEDPPAGFELVYSLDDIKVYKED